MTKTFRMASIAGAAALVCSLGLTTVSPGHAAQRALSADAATTYGGRSGTTDFSAGRRRQALSRNTARANAYAPAAAPSDRGSAPGYGYGYGDNSKNVIN